MLKHSRLLALPIIALAIVPMYFFAVSDALSPQLFEGDRIEERPCRRCAGSGKDEDMPEFGGRCTFCRASGTVKVIVPGPNRPTRVWGAVVDRELAGGSIPLHAVRRRGAPSPFMPEEMRGIDEIRGALADAEVVFIRKGSEPIVVRTNPEGRFSKRLPPGDYSVEVRAPGYTAYTPKKKLEIDPLTGEIWLERATMIEPVDPTGYEGILPEEARSSYGLLFVAGVDAKRSKRGFIRTQVAGP